ncbi:MAG TPA: GNAT family N-acetyltransferase [Anaerolineales bacterium]|nr:GNAT family N-acetyltransferase [Anaerolineales bacterium]
MIPIRRLTQDDLPRLRQFWIERWDSEEMVIHGEVFRLDQLDGFVTEDWQGVLAYYVRDEECEIVSLDSLWEGQGIGTELIHAIVEEARSRNCRRIFLSTTNDNLHALRFYQKRGFELVAVHRGAVNESRKIKPSIPLTGYDGIPIRDEIELELSLPGT